MVIKNLNQLIGNTPLLLLNKLSKEYKCNIYLKLEKYNSSGSSKDRAIKKMIEVALKEKKINNDSTIIEPTSGNSGISIASICANYSLKCIIVMPSNANIERVKLIRAYGGKVVFSDATLNINGSIKKAKELLKTTPNSFMLSQFDNYNNILAHYETTAKEIYDDLPLIDCFVSTYGTGGTISGISKYLKQKNKNIQCVSITPNSKKHHIPGIYSNATLKNYNKNYIDKTIKVDDIDAFKMIKYVAKQEGILIGLSSGCALAGAIKLLKRNCFKNIVILCPDGFERYLSNEYVFYLDNLENTQIKNDLDIMFNCLFHEHNSDIWLKYLINKNEVKCLYNKLMLDARAMYLNDPSANSLSEVIDLYPGFYAIFSHRIANILWKNNHLKVARMISECAHKITSIDIHPQAKIGKCFAIDHGSGIVIGQTCSIGNNVRIYQGVTLGALSLNDPAKYIGKKRHPTIKNNVIIYANATILGGKTIIGNNVIIGGNSFITSSIKDNNIVSSKQNNYKITKKKASSL